MRRTPEDSGLRPDGETGGGKRGDALTEAAERRSYTGSQAVRSPGFWLLLFGYSMNQAALASVLVHAVPFATDASFSRRTAALALAVTGLGNLVSKAVWGYCLQRFPPRRLASGRVFDGGRRRGHDAACRLNRPNRLCCSPDSSAMVSASGAPFRSANICGSATSAALTLAPSAALPSRLRSSGPRLLPCLSAWDSICRAAIAWGFIGIIVVYLLAGLLVGISRPPRVLSG